MQRFSTANVKFCNPQGEFPTVTSLCRASHVWLGPCSHTYSGSLVPLGESPAHLCPPRDLHFTHEAPSLPCSSWCSLKHVLELGPLLGPLPGMSFRSVNPVQQPPSLDSPPRSHSEHPSLSAPSLTPGSWGHLYPALSPHIPLSPSLDIFPVAALTDGKEV